MDDGFDFSVLSEFRTRLMSHGAEARLFEIMLACFQERDLFKAGGKQRTDSTHILVNVRELNQIEFVGETMRVTHEAIMAIQREETVARMRGEERVLLIQDTTSFNFSHHPETVGLGPLENKGCEGFLAHNTLAVSTAGVPLSSIKRKLG